MIDEFKSDDLSFRYFTMFTSRLHASERASMIDMQTAVSRFTPLIADRLTPLADCICFVKPIYETRNGVYSMNLNLAFPN